ncbi:hypothetical protein Tco_1038487 [Tanacetum coccineum]
MSLIFTAYENRRNLNYIDAINARSEGDERSMSGGGDGVVVMAASRRRRKDGFWILDEVWLADESKCV